MQKVKICLFIPCPCYTNSHFSPVITIMYLDDHFHSDTSGCIACEAPNGGPCVPLFLSQVMGSVSVEHKKGAKNYPCRCNKCGHYPTESSDSHIVSSVEACLPQAPENLHLLRRITHRIPRF